MTTATQPIGLTAVTISGVRQADVDDSADFRTWAALAGRLGRAECVWAGPRLECRRGPLHVHRRPRHPGPQSLIWVAGSVRIGVRLARAAQRRGETVVVNGTEPWGWLSAWLVSRLVRSPWLMDVHGDYLALPVASLGRWRRAVLRRAVVFFARRADTRRAVSRSISDSLAGRFLPCAEVPPRLLPVWEEPLKRERPPLESPALRLLTVGRLVASKGFDLLLAAVAELVRTEPAVRLRIVGDGPLRDRLTDEAARLGLSPHVEFLGTRDLDDIRAELSRADLFVISSRDEGLPRTLLEATAAGVPVVATSVGGIPAVAAGWGSVRLVPVDAAAIASGVRQVLASPPGAEQLASVRRQVLDTYGFENNIDMLTDLFQSVTPRK
ncbi:glycosyltransferase [Streptomyces sp. AC555_RSS877]|uniref:glycosyltransferase n=1 Tax=Streptomyces sp. AC555_RSS877 TaxID=2823688 RepID=UPI001C26D62F|nr:glycosyltransferase [Streptomyces sp. AC555_RSS877]